MSLRLKIVSPEKIVFDGEVKSITVPGTLGRFEVLENHAPIISSLEKGVVECVEMNDKRNSIDINGGFIEVQKNVVSVCVELQ